jgi:hypothetical protein
LFNHILDNILGRRDGTPLTLALSEEGIDDIFALSNLTDSDNDSLMFTNKDQKNTLTPIRMADRNLPRTFLHFVINANLEGQAIIGEAWNEINQDEFNAFRINPKYMVRLTSAFSMPGASDISKSPPPPKHTPTFTHQT